MRPSSTSWRARLTEGTPPVIVPDHVRHAGLLDRRHHGLALGHVHGQGLLAQDGLAVGSRRQGDLLVQIVGHADVDGVDVGALDQLAPVGLDRSVAPDVGERLHLGRIAPADRLQHWTVLELGKEVRDLAPSVGMRPAHEAVADHADPIGRGHALCSLH